MSEENVIAFKQRSQKGQPEEFEVVNEIPESNLKAHWYQISYVFSLREGHVGIGSYFNYRTNPIEVVNKQEMLNRLEGARHYIEGKPLSLTIIGILYCGYGTMDECIVQES